MRHFTFAPNAEDTPFKVAVLIKTSYFDQANIEEYYVKPMVKLGIPAEDIIAIDLPYFNNKVTASQAKMNLAHILKACKQVGISTLFVADSAYFKALTGLNKAETHIGYLKPCKIRDYEYLNICYGLNYAVFMRNPNQITKLDMAIDTVTDHYKGTFVPVGHNVMKNPLYLPNPDDYDAFEMALDSMLRHPMLVCDIESWGLKLEEAGVASIAFAWNKNEGLAAYTRLIPTQDGRRTAVKLLKKFFERYSGTLIFHNCTYDIKNIIFNIFMEHPRDMRGMIHGLHTMFKSVHDTKVIAYLATNSTAGNELGLKVLAHPYLGNYGLNVSDITKLPLRKLLEYNLKDCLGTFYVFEKYYPIMLADKQEDIYKNIMMPSAKLITQMELHGMPIDMDKVISTTKDMEVLKQDYLVYIMASKSVLQATDIIRHTALAAINSKLKTKQHGLERVEDIEFNPGSPNQLQILLYDVLALPVLDLTKTGASATGAKTLEKLVHHTQDDHVKALLISLIDLSKVDKILSTFMPAFAEAFPKDGWHYLHGSFNLGGTLSGRLSSSNPNLQNLPSGSRFGKAVKQCFKAKSGWLFVGADFSSLNLGE